MMKGSIESRNTTVGILSNPQSGRINSVISEIRDIALTIPGAIYREACDQAEFGMVLDEFSERKIDLLVIIAGDGTVHAVLSYMLSTQIFSPQPNLAIIPAGTTNMTAKDFKAHGKPLRLMGRLAKLLIDNSNYASTSRPVLRIQNADEIPRYGMFFGVGLIADGVKYFQERVKGLAITGEKASGVVLLRFFYYLMLGRRDVESLKARTYIQMNECIGKDENPLLVFATSLDRLLLGMRPYWGTQEDKMHVTLVQNRPKRLWRSILPLVTGRGAGLAEEDGYHSDNLSSLTLSLTGDYIIDGEIYTASKEKGKVHISAKDSISVMELNN